MKIQPDKNQGGFTILVVLVLLLLMAAFVIGNARTLAALKKEVRLVEQRQLMHWASLAKTNAPPKIQP